MPNNDPVFAPDELLLRLAKEYGTPLQVYDRATLAQQAGKLTQAFGWDTGFRQYFPVLACSNPHMLKAILAAGSGLLCTSEAQLRLAALAGATGEQLLFTANAPQAADWQAALSSGATIVLDSADQLKQIPVQAYGNRVLGIQVRPSRGYTSPGIRQTAMLYKSGMLPDVMVATAIQAARRGFSRLGLYMQVSSSSAIQGHFARVIRYLLELAKEVRRRTRLTVIWCNLGDGMDYSSQVDVAKEGDAVRRVVQESEFPEMHIHMAQGRFLAAPAGITLTSVLGIKAQERNLAVLDVSLAHLPRLMIPGARYFATVLGEKPPNLWENYLLCGPLLDKLDTFSGRYILPKMRAGDILALHDTGAYCRSMASNYGGVGRCPEVLLDWEGPRLICPGETREQWLANQWLPPEPQ